MGPPNRDEVLARVASRFERLYGPLAPRLMDRFSQLVAGHPADVRGSGVVRHWSERDAVLITYGDSVARSDEPPLATLARFLERDVGDAVNTVHILPFFPYSSDDGFSVVDFRAVNPDLGDWDDVRTIAGRYRLMCDLVLNHVSRGSRWFRDFERGVAPGRDYFITPDPSADLSAVVRPRTHPLLTRVETGNGPRFVWTTFSDDQMDLNYANPDVLFEMLETMLLYVARGVRILRLDAVAYVWKRLGSRCIHLPEAHEIVKLMRDLLALVSPGVLIVTETNVPHAENVSYFGRGDEADAVYQFSLPPLLLHAMTTGDATHLSRWATAVGSPPPGCTFLNFTASHDGIGLRPLEGLLPSQEVQRLVRHVESRDGRVSMRTGADGSEVPYELNCTWFDAMGGTGDEPGPTQLARFLCSQALSLALQGVPAVYVHSLLATPNDLAGMAATGRVRSINRRRWDEGELRTALDDRSTPAFHVLHGMIQMLRARASSPAFDPAGPQRVLDLDSRVFAVERAAASGPERVIALHNVSAEAVTLRLPGADARARDLLGGVRPDPEGLVSLAPYAASWLALPV